MPGRPPPPKCPFSADFKRGTIKSSNGCMKIKFRIRHSCPCAPAGRGESNPGGTAQDASCQCNESKHKSESDATAEETVVTPGFSTFANVNQSMTSLKWQDPEEYVKWWSASSDSTLRDGLIGGFTYFMDDFDLEWLQSHNSSRLNDTTDLDYECQVAAPEIGEDVFELVVGLFEMISQFAVQFRVTHSQKQLKKNSIYETLPLTEFDTILSAPLNPTIFMSGQAPSWFPSPKSLSEVASSIYKHWQQRKLERQGHRLIPVIERNFHKKPPLGYACLAPCPSRNDLWWSSAARSADFPPGPAPLLGRSLSQMWDDHLRSISKIRDEVPVVNARYAFNQFRKFCKDDIAPTVADMQNTSAQLHQGEEKRKSLTLEILAKDLKVVHDHENLLSVQRVNEYLKDYAERTGKSNVTLRKPQPKQRNVTRKVKLKATKRTWKAQPKMGQFSPMAAHNSRIIKPGCPPVSPPFSRLHDHDEKGTTSGRWVIRIGPSSHNYRPLTMVYVTNNQDTSASPTPSTSYEVHSATISGSTVEALSKQVSAGQALVNEKELAVQTSSSPTNVSSESRHASVASAPALVPIVDSAISVTFGSQIHQNASFSFTVPAKQGGPTAKSSGVNGSLSAPASLGSVDHTPTPKVPPKASPQSPKAHSKPGAKQPGQNGRPPRKRARTGARSENDENLPQHNVA